MKPGAFYPYLVALDAVDLVVNEVTGGTLHRESIDAYSEPHDKVEIAFELRVDRGALQDLMPGVETLEEAFAAGVRIIGKESRRRRLESLPSLEGGAITFTLDRRDWVGSVAITGIVYRRSLSGSPEAGYASDLGAVVAWSDDLNVYMDAREPTIHGEHLEVRWASFNNDIRLRDSAADLFAIRDDGQSPVVFLNTDIQHAYAVLDSKGTHGAKARIRDATFYLIAHQVWSSLLGDALQRARGEARHHESGDSDEILEGLGGWRAMVLEAWAPLLAGGSDDPIADLIDSDTRVLIEQLPGAIQGRFKTIDGFKGLIRDISSLGN